MKAPVRIVHMIACLEMGGSQSMVMNLYRAIDRSKVQFDFIVDHPDRDANLRDEIISLGGKIYDFPTFRGWNILEIKRKWNLFFSEHKEYKVLHTHSRSYASLYLPIAKKHGLITIAHSHSMSNGKGITAVIKKLMQLPIRYQADYLFACSAEAGEWLFGKKALNRVKVIPNAINSKQFVYDEEARIRIRKELGVKDGDFLVGHVGRMTPVKNHIFLLRVFAELKNVQESAKLLLVGDGELYSDIQKLICDLGLCDDVLVVGSKANPSEYYQAMDCFVFPSLWEGLGMAVIEAQCAGLPCCVSDTVPHKVDVGAGLVTFLSLEDSYSKWVKMIRRTSRVNTSDYIIKAGYDIVENAATMQTFYESL